MAWKSAVAIIVLLSSFGGVFGATVHGNVYEWSTLELIDNVIIEINTEPAQTMVVKSGSYAFEVPPGNYVIEAKYYKNNLLEYHTIENISAVDEGNYVLDIVMFPALDIEEFFETEDISFDEIFGDENSTEKENRWLWPILVLILLLGSGIWILRERRIRAPLAPEVEGGLPEDLSRLLRVLEKNDGRMTQKELRKDLDLSEAKVSLMITDLESRGLVKRVKKGRGNVIIRTKRQNYR